MSKYGTFTSLPDLKEWFDYAADKNDTTEWILYHGLLMKSNGSAGQRNAEQRDENLTAEESWALLEQVITAQSKAGGNFTVYMPTRGTNVGQRAFISLANPAGSGMFPGVAGIYGPEYVSKEIDNFKTQFLLEQQIKELREEMNAKRNPLEQVATQLLDSGVVGAIIQGFAAKALGLDAPGVSGNGMHDESVVQQGVGIEYNLHRLSAVIPDLPTVLEKLARFAEAQPDMARAMLKNLDNFAQDGNE